MKRLQNEWPELQAVEQDAVEELRKKQVSLWKAVEEAQRNTQEKEEVTAQEWQEANMREWEADHNNDIIFRSD